jgi:hypothetical protein
VAAAKRKGKRNKRASADAPAEASTIAGAPAPSLRTYALLSLATVYLATVWLDGVGSNLPAKISPRPWVYFGQIAALFKWAGQKQIDYRAEGFVCADKRWVEIDVRAFFPLDRGNKENRFYRAVQFYRRDRKVMRALEEFVLERHNARVETDKRIGGVRFLSLRIPYPEPGARIEPYERRELATYPPDQRHDWYWTPGNKRRERCGDHAPSHPPKDDDEERSSTTKTPEDER